MPIKGITFSIKLLLYRHPKCQLMADHEFQNPLRRPRLPRVQVADKSSHRNLAVNPMTIANTKKHTKCRYEAFNNQ